MSAIVYLPLDERPCNLNYPQSLAKLGMMDLVAPDPSLLGNKKKAAQFDSIAEWVLRETVQAKHFIVSVDMLVYGGIVPSRLHHLSEAECARRLDILRTIKQRRPDINIFAFNLITRVPAYSSSEEEPDYYCEFGREIYEYGALSDKQDRAMLSEVEQLQWLELTKAIPQHILSDYLKRRKVNTAINHHVIDLVKENIIDFLIIPLDDNSEYGFSAQEQRSMMVRIEQEGLMDQIAIYPGADEIGCTLLAKVFCEQKGYSPRVFIQYSSTKGPLCIPKYEDRSLHESVKAHLTTTHATITPQTSDADVILMINSPPVGQEHMAETTDLFAQRHASYFSEINYREFVEAICYYTSIGKLTALADVSICNGGDHVLMSWLHQRNQLHAITAYAGWNTSGNSLGTTISHAVIESYFQTDEGQKESIASRQRHSKAYYYSRLIEDWGYQSIVRQDVCEHILPNLQASYFHLHHAQAEIEQHILTKLQQFNETYVNGHPGYQISVEQVSLPWQRMFEIDLKLRLSERN